MTRNVIQNTRPSFTFWESLGTTLGGGGEVGRRWGEGRHPAYREGVV